MFEAVIGSDYTSDIALDDYSVVGGPCPSPASCDFETDLCGYENDKLYNTDDFDWIRRSGRTPSVGTGPPTDHTTLSTRGER